MIIPVFGGLGSAGTPGTPFDPTPNPADAHVFYVPDYFSAAGSGDLAGITDSTDAFYLARDAAEAYAAVNGHATIYLGTGTLRMYPKHFQPGFMYPMFYYMTSDNITVAGTYSGAAGGSTRILLDAGPLDEGDPARDPTDLIVRRGEAFHIRAANGCRWRDIWLDGQAPVTANAGSGSDGPDHIHQTNGWDWSHKAFLWEHDTSDNLIERFKVTNFRGEMVYASGSTDPTTGERPGTITIDASYLSDSNGSLFSCSASMTVTNTVVRSCYNGVENYCFATPTPQNTVISGNDIQPQVAATLTKGVVNNGLTYEITGNTGADFTGVGAPDNNIGTTFKANVSAVPTWGTGGELSRTIGSNAIVVLGQIGTTTTITNNHVARCDTGLLSTDFGHNFTLSGNVWEDVTRVYLLSPIQTSSSTSDMATHAGWNNWSLSNETVRNVTKLTQGVFVLQQSGSHVPNDWSVDGLVFDPQNGFYVQRVIFQGGVWGTWEILNTDFDGTGPVVNETNVGPTMPRAKLTGCTNMAEITTYLNSDPDVFEPTTDGASYFIASAAAATIPLLDTTLVLPDQFSFTIRTTTASFTFTWDDGGSGGSYTFSGVDNQSFVYDKTTDTLAQV